MRSDSFGYCFEAAGPDGLKLAGVKKVHFTHTAAMTEYAKVNGVKLARPAILLSGAVTIVGAAMSVRRVG